jgi:signal transduction histidine kinase
MAELVRPADHELRQLRTLAARNALLSEVVLLIARAPSLDRLLSGAVNRFKWALDFECCRLALARGDGATYDLRTLIETRRGIAKIQAEAVPVSQGLCGRIISSGRVSLSPGGDPPDDTLGIVLALPLTTYDRVLGAVMFGAARHDGLGEDDIKIARSFAAHLALAIDRWQQTAELQRVNTNLVLEKERVERLLADLKAAQANLIQAEKMASLGQLTAGIAHEIKNPLNFVNNFAGLSIELLDELKETAAPGIATLDDHTRAEIDETIEMLTGNLDKVAEHGKRADGIVKSMLEHSRGVSGDRRAIDLNNLIDEALNLAYHGARAQNQNFNIALERHYAPLLKPIEVAPQEITRVFLNLIGNGFYAATKRARENGGRSFQPTLTVATRDLGEVIEVKVRDNGTGIAPEIRDKLFQPFLRPSPLARAPAWASRSATTS